MISYTDDELEALCRTHERDAVEFKESFRGDSPEKVREAVCAFANDLPGRGRAGIVVIGLRDDGTSADLAITDELERQLSDIRTDGNILPLPSLLVERRRVRGADVVVLTVFPAVSPPVRYKGRVWVRVGPRRAIASAQDERILNERRRYRDRPFDAQPLPSAALSDLDVEGFRRVYLPAAVASDVLEANDRTLEQRLAAMKMIAAENDPTPTVLGVLVCGRDPLAHLPGAYIQFLRIAGSELGDPIVDEQRIGGTVAELLRRVEDKLIAHNRVAVDYTSGPLEKRHSLYPMVALQQLTRNAVLHRSYEGTNAPVRIYWFDDRIEIGSPGGPFGAVTVENFGQPQFADYRNPNLAEALRVLGFIQKFGSGIAIARRALRENGNHEPEFQVGPANVQVIVRAKS